MEQTPVNLNENELQLFKIHFIDKYLSTNNGHLVAGYVSNLYKLATDYYPELKTRVEEHDEKEVEHQTEIATLIKNIDDTVDKTLAKLGITTSRSRIGRDEYIVKLHVQGQTLSAPIYIGNYDNKGYALVEFLNVLIAKYQKAENSTILQQYNELARKYNSSIFRKGKIKKDMEHMLDNEKVLQDYFTTAKVLHVLKRALSELQKHNSLFDELRDKRIAFNEPYKRERDTLYADVNKKIKIPLALAYVNLYNRQLESCEGSPEEIASALKSSVISSTDYFYRDPITEVAENLDKYLEIEKIAVSKYEQWREQFKKEDGSYSQKWKLIDDPIYLERVSNMTFLPHGVRVDGGVVEQDIVNCSYKDLALAFQLSFFDEAEQEYQQRQEAKNEPVLEDE